MNQQAGGCIARLDLGEDLVEGDRAMLERAAERHAQHEERSGQAPGNRDLDVTQVLARKLSGRDDHGPVTGPDRRPVG